MYKPKRSAEFHHYCKTLRCPNGHRRALTFVEGTGIVVTSLELRDRLLLEHPVPKLEERMRSSRALAWLHEKNHEFLGGVSIQRFRVDSAIECLACDERWPVFLQRERQFTVLRQSEPRRVTTPLGEDERRLDNRASKTANKFSEEYEHSWLQRTEARWAQAETVSSGASAGAKWSAGVASFGASVERRLAETITKQLSIVIEESRRTVKTVEVDVPAGMLLKLRLTWKQVWVEVDYEIQLRGSEEVVKVPVRIPVDVILDRQVIHV